MLSRFWTLRAGGGETSLSESVEKETFLTKIFFQVMLNEVLYVKKKTKTKGAGGSILK